MESRSFATRNIKPKSAKKPLASLIVFTKSCRLYNHFTIDFNGRFYYDLRSELDNGAL